MNDYEFPRKKNLQSSVDENQIKFPKCEYNTDPQLSSYTQIS